MDLFPNVTIGPTANWLNLTVVLFSIILRMLQNHENKNILKKYFNCGLIGILCGLLNLEFRWDNWNAKFVNILTCENKAIDCILIDVPKEGNVIVSLHWAEIWLNWGVAYRRGAVSLYIVPAYKHTALGQLTLGALSAGRATFFP